MSKEIGKGTLIIGGGVIGLGIAWRLAQAGEPVLLLDKGEAGHEASWAAAGMLAPISEIHFQEDQNLQLGLESLERYPAFVHDLEAAAGMPVGYRKEGGLAISLQADETAELKHLFEYQQNLALDVEWLGGDEVQRRVPALSHNVVAGVYCPVEHQVDNRLLGQALKKALVAAGGELREHTPVEAVHLREDGPPEVVAGGQTLRREKLLLAAGAWSGMLPGLDGALRPWVRPVKGQMLSIQAPPGMLAPNLRTPDIYIAPRADGRLIVGATVEEMGFDTSQTVGGVYELLRGVWRAIPGAYEMPLLESWCGFRPGSRDNAPILGETEIPGFYIATGHYRNGILNTPVTAHHMSRLLLGEPLPDYMGHFSPGRF